MKANGIANDAILQKGFMFLKRIAKNAARRMDAEHKSVKRYCSLFIDSICNLSVL
jgi:hypothetical protein